MGVDQTSGTKSQYKDAKPADTSEQGPRLQEQTRPTKTDSPCLVYKSMNRDGDMHLLQYLSSCPLPFYTGLKSPEREGSRDQVLTACARMSKTPSERERHPAARPDHLAAPWRRRAPWDVPPPLGRGFRDLRARERERERERA